MTLSINLLDLPISLVSAIGCHEEVTLVGISSPCLVSASVTGSSASASDHSATCLTAIPCTVYYYYNYLLLLSSGIQAEFFFFLGGGVVFKFDYTLLGVAM